MADPLDNPRTTSSDYNAMSDYWEMVRAILAGAPALRELGVTYLPAFENEDSARYEARRWGAPLTNIYADISRNLASKPFSKEVDLNEDAPDVLAGVFDPTTKRRTGGLVDDIDGQGNSLHVFAAESFKAGVDKGIDWILVEFSKAQLPGTGRQLSRAEERAQKLRPYWVSIPCERLLAAYVAFIDGREVLVHARIHEPIIVRNGYIETTRNRVRVFNREPAAFAPNDPSRPIAFRPATWELWEEQTEARSGGAPWIMIDQGIYSKVEEIPLVPFIPGKRHGTSFVVDPPLRDLAYMQIEEFQQESNLKEAKNLTAHPMLVGIGVDLPKENVIDPVTLETVQRPIKVPVGPRSVLITPPNGDGTVGDWRWLEPQAQSLVFLKDDLQAFRQEMRDLGMQPLMAANMTVITSAHVSQKASSAVQAWAILFKDTLDRCLALTSKWLGIDDTTEVVIHTDFAVEVESAGDTDALTKIRLAGDLTRATLWSELQRRGKLGPDFDPEAEEQNLKTEEPSLGMIPVDQSPGSQDESAGTTEE